MTIGLVGLGFFVLGMVIGMGHRYADVEFLKSELESVNQSYWKLLQVIDRDRPEWKEYEAKAWSE